MKEDFYNWKEPTATNVGIVIGTLSAVALVDLISSVTKRPNVPFVGYMGAALLGATVGGYYGYNAGNKWLSSSSTSRTKNAESVS